MGAVCVGERRGSGRQPTMAGDKGSEAGASEKSVVVVSPIGIIEDVLRRGLPAGTTVTRVSSWEDEQPSLIKYPPDLLVVDAESSQRAASLIRRLPNCLALVVCDVSSLGSFCQVLAPPSVGGWLPRAGLRAETLVDAAGSLLAGKRLAQVDLAYHDLPRQRALPGVPELESKDITGAERDVALLLAADLTQSAAAQRLGASVRTIERHVEAMHRKTGLASPIALGFALGRMLESGAEISSSSVERSSRSREPNGVRSR